MMRFGFLLIYLLLIVADLVMAFGGSSSGGSSSGGSSSGGSSGSAPFLPMGYWFVIFGVIAIYSFFNQKK